MKQNAIAKKFEKIDPNSEKTVAEQDPDKFTKSIAFYKKHRDFFCKKLLYELQQYEPITVETDCDAARLDRMLAHIQSIWLALGKKDAYWSVVTMKDFRTDTIEENKDQFYASGWREAKNLDRLLTRTGLDRSHWQSAMEYGCGVGRLTGFLARRFGHVTGVDISDKHIALARQYLNQQDISNVDFVKLEQISELEQLKPVDFIYSKIVLQHNPPPVMKIIFDRLLKALNPGGGMVIQFPTYRRRYTFIIDDYLQEMDSIEKMEMHVLPQHTAFQLIQDHGCIVREVMRDHMARANFVSNTFVIEKLRGV